MGIEYLSPSALMSWEADPKEFYLTRILRLKKKEQTVAMATGSAFDELVKKEIHSIFLEGSSDYLNQQLECQDAETARVNGHIVFKRYKESGAFAEICNDINNSVVGTLRMETTVRGTVGGVPLLGKPDLCFKMACEGSPLMFILDWKVNGFTSLRLTSPKKGYNICREPSGTSVQHKDYMPLIKCGITLNGFYNLEDVDKAWALQTCTYAWMLGAPVGSEIACGIDQIVNRDCRVASYRMLVGEAFQLEAIKRYQSLWDVVTNERWDDELLSYAEGFKHPSDAKENWLDNAIRGV
jgi:hypothetical protein